MTDHDLSELLDRLGERTDVSPPPTAVMLAEAGRLQKRRTRVRATLAAASVVAVLGGTALAVTLAGDGDSGSDPAPGTATPTIEPTPEPVPDGMRLVGIGHAAIAVPQEWATNALSCLTPMEDTVIIDLGAVCLGLFGRPADVESVWVYAGWYGGFGNREEAGGHTTTVDGVRIEGFPTECSLNSGRSGEPMTCTDAVYLPDHDVTFLAESSTSPEARELVIEMLSRIRVAPELVAVPGFQRFDLEHDDDDAGSHYAQALELLGFEVRIDETRATGFSKPGFIVDVQPAPGTMLEPGEEVIVTVVAH